MTAVSGSATHPGFLGLQRQLLTLLPQADGATADQAPLERLGSNRELHRLYAPARRLSATWREALESLPVPLVDTSDNPPGEQELTDHPFALRDSAIHRVQKDRESAERELAERWCALEKGALFIDGGI